MSIQLQLGYTSTVQYRGTTSEAQNESKMRIKAQIQCSVASSASPPDSGTHENKTMTGTKPHSADSNHQVDHAGELRCRDALICMLCCRREPRQRWR
jgi:hypothetical protein